MTKASCPGVVIDSRPLAPLNPDISAGPYKRLMVWMDLALAPGGGREKWSPFPCPNVLKIVSQFINLFLTDAPTSSHNQPDSERLLGQGEYLQMMGATAYSTDPHHVTCISDTNNSPVQPSSANGPINGSNSPLPPISSVFQVGINWYPF